MKTSHMWFQVAASLLTCAGCLPDRRAVQEPGAYATPLAVSVHDPAGGSWPHTAIPRRPALALHFAEPPARPEERLWLVRDGANADILDDLADPPLRAATQQALVPLTVRAESPTVWAEPASTLPAGARFDLVWTRAEEPAFVHALTVSTSPAAGAQLVESLPGDRDVRVPPNTRRLLLRFDGYVHGLDAEHVLLRLREGHAVPATLEVRACDALALPAGDCVLLSPSAPLEPRRDYEITLLDGLLDATGSPLPAQVLSFSTTAERDHEPPRGQAVPCALDESARALGCALVRGTRGMLRGAVSEPALVTLSAGDEHHAVLAASGLFEVQLADIARDRDTIALLRFEDLAGHVTEHSVLFPRALEQATLAIDELRPDPLGPEPAQEYVELLNFGPLPVQIMGFSLTDSAFDEGRHIVTPLEVAAGERVLVVAPEFDPGDAADGPLPAGVRLVRLDGALSLRNDGELLILRDAQGARIDESPRMGPASAGQCIARVPRGEGFAFIRDPAFTCTPGRETRELSQ